MTSTLPVIPDDLHALMAEIGPRWQTNRLQNIATMIDRFSEVLKQSPRDGINVTRNVPYGRHSRQQLDVHSPSKVGSGRPAVLFIHGGAFMDGDRNRTDMIYSNIPTYFAQRGIVGINVGYRLGDAIGYPGATEDVASTVRWARENAPSLGVDPGRIFLMGHSAGAAHAASYAYDRRRQPSEGHGLAGLIVLSGRVRADARPKNPNAQKVIAYYGTDDPQQLDDVSPVSHVGPHSVPTLIAWGEYENPLIDVHCAELVFRLAQAKNHAPPVFRLRGHNHTSTMAHVGTSDNLLGSALVDFVNNAR